LCNAAIIKGGDDRVKLTTLASYEGRAAEKGSKFAALVGKNSKGVEGGTGEGKTTFNGKKKHLASRPRDGKEGGGKIPERVGFVYRTEQSETQNKKGEGREKKSSRKERLIKKNSIEGLLPSAKRKEKGGLSARAHETETYAGNRGKDRAGRAHWKRGEGLVAARGRQKKKTGQRTTVRRQTFPVRVKRCKKRTRLTRNRAGGRPLPPSGANRGKCAVYDWERAWTSKKEIGRVVAWTKRYR